MRLPFAQRQALWAAHLQTLHGRLPRQFPPLLASGRLVRMIGLVLEAEGFDASVGTRCRVEGSHHRGIDAEVVGFHGDRLQLMAAGDLQGVAPGARVQPLPGQARAGVGAHLLGRIVDGQGQVLDGQGLSSPSNMYPSWEHPSIPCSERRCSVPWMWGYAPSMPCLPWVGERVWDFSPEVVWVKVFCWG